VTLGLRRRGPPLALRRSIARLLRARALAPATPNLPGLALRLLVESRRGVERLGALVILLSCEGGPGFRPFRRGLVPERGRMTLGVRRRRASLALRRSIARFVGARALAQAGLARGLAQPVDLPSRLGSGRNLGSLLENLQTPGVAPFVQRRARASNELGSDLLALLVGVRHPLWLFAEASGRKRADGTSHDFT